MATRTSGNSGKRHRQRRTAIALLVVIGIVFLIFVGVKVQEIRMIKQWITDLGSPNVDLRRDGYLSLKGLGPKAIPYLRQVVKAKRGSLRVGVAARLIGEMGDRESIPMLIGLMSEPDDVIRRNAAAGLGYLSVEEAVPQLLPCIDASDDTLCKNAIWALGRIGRPAKAASPRLIEIFSKAKQTKRLQLACAAALGRIGDPAAIPVLSKELDPEAKDLDIVTAAVRALGDIGSQKAVRPLEGLLFRQMPDRTPIPLEGPKVEGPENVPLEIRLEILRALVKIGGPDAKAAVKKCAETAVSVVVKRAAEKALAEMKD